MRLTAVRESSLLSSGNQQPQRELHRVDTLSSAAHGTLQPPRVTGTFDYGPGGIIGVAEFIFSRPRSFRAAAATDNTRVLQMSRAQWLQCAAEEPAAVSALQEALLKLTCLQELHDPLHYPVIA